MTSNDLRAKLNRAVESSENLESVLRDISHELRNPLMAILTAAEALEDCADPKDRAAALAVIRRQSAKLADTIESLVDGGRESKKAEAPHLPASKGTSGVGPVLLVEDQEDNREMLAMALRRVGKTIVTAGDVGEAKAAIDEQSFSIAIVDVGLPDGSGHDVARAARDKFGESIKLIALTGQGLEMERGEILASGFDVHLVKPVSLTELHQALETHVPVDASGPDSATAPIQVVAFGPEILVASGIECFVANRDAFELNETASNAEEAKKILASSSADVALIYASPADGLGPDFVRTISVSTRGLGICIVVEGGEDSLARECMIAGADACLATSSEPDDLLKAVKIAHGEGTFVAAEVDAMVGRDQVFTRLTRREREVLKLVADGSTSREISAELEIAYKTVDTHRQNIVRKLGSRSVADLVKHAIRSGLTDLDVTPRKPRF